MCTESISDKEIEEVGINAFLDVTVEEFWRINECQ